MSVGRILKHVSLYLTLGSLILLFVALGAAEFLKGSFQSGKTAQQVQLGLFSSCSTIGGYQCKYDVFWWANRSARLMNKHWRAFQSFLLLEVIFKGVCLMVMRGRHRLEMRNPSRVPHMRLLLPLLQISTMVVGATAIGLAVTAENRFEKQFAASLKQGMSLQLEIAGFAISAVAFFLYSISWCAEPKTFVQSASQLQAQHVTVNINGQSIQATLQPSAPPMPLNIHPMAMQQRNVYPVPAHVVQHQFTPLVPGIGHPYPHPNSYPTIYRAGENTTATDLAI